MELGEQSASDLFLAKGDTPLGLNNVTAPETALDHTVPAEVKDITVQVIALEGHKLELPIPSEAIIEPISPVEVTLEDCGLTAAPHEAREEEATASDDSKGSQDHLSLASSALCIQHENNIVNSSALESNPSEALSLFIDHKDLGEASMGSDVTGASDPNTLLDPRTLDKEAACAINISADSASNSLAPRVAGCSSEDKVVRKNIPPKKDRLDPLKIDMSKPTLFPLTSSQLSLQCLECHIIFSDNKSKQRHLKMNHPSEYQQCMLGDALFACYVCDRHFTCSAELLAHQRSHTEKQPFKCPICGEAFNRLSELTIHKKIHFGKHGYTCSDCGKHCKTLTLLKYHQRVHTGERPYVCIHKDCGKRFSMIKPLHKHLEAHKKGETEVTEEPANGVISSKKKRTRGPSAKKYACSQCDESFKTVKSQLRHIRIKHGPYQTTTPSFNTVVAQELNGNPAITSQTSVMQPPVLCMEAIGPVPQQIGPLGAEQIKRLIEKLGNVQRVNQLVILGVDQLTLQQQAMGIQQPQQLLQPVHFNFTEPTMQTVVVQQAEDQQVHQVTVSTGNEETTCKDLLKAVMAVEQVQEETTMVLSVNSEEQAAAAESDMRGAQLNEVQLVPEHQLEESDKQGQTTEEPDNQVAFDVNSVESRAASSLTSTNDFEMGQFQATAEEDAPISTDMMASEEAITHQESLSQRPDDLENRQSQVIEEEHGSVPTDIIASEETIAQEMHVMERPNDFENQQSKTVLEEHVFVPTDIMAAEETISQEESLGQELNKADSLEEKEPETEHVNIVPLSNSQDIDGHLEPAEKDIPCSESPIHQPSLNKVQKDQENSHMEQEPSNKSVTQPSTEQDQSDVKDGLHSKKVLPLKKKRSKKQGTQRSQHLGRQGEVAKGPSQKTPQKGNTPSKPGPKKREKAKSKKHVHFGAKERCSKQQSLQKLSKKNIDFRRKDANISKVPGSSQNDSVPQLKPKNQKHKKAKTAENPSGAIKTINVSSNLKVNETPRGKTQKRKLETQKHLVKKRKSQEIQLDESPKKKKKQGKATEAIPQKKTKVKSATANEQRKEIPKLAKQEEKEQKNNSQSSSQDQIKQQALLLLKGHKQPQLKVHKLDPKATGLEQPRKETFQNKDINDKETTVVKAKRGTQKKAIQKGSQNKKKTKIVGKKSKKDLASLFHKASADSGLNSALSNTKAKVPRKRKPSTKIDQEIALSPPFSRLTIGCHDCGLKFSEVPALQEHMASLHSENGLLQPNTSCDVSDDPMISPRSNEMILANAVPIRNFEIQVSTDWDMDTEIRDIGLGERDVHRLTFPALSPSPSFPLTTTCEDSKVEGRICRDTYPEYLETLGENSTEIVQSVPKVLSNETNTGHIHMTDRKSVGMENTEVESVQPSSAYGPQDIKEELPLDVNLVLIEDQNEGHIPTQTNSLFNSQEVSSQQGDELSHELNLTTTQTQSQVPLENSSSSTQNSLLTEESDIKHEEEEILVQRLENQTKTVTSSRKGRGSRGRGKKQLGKRSTAENRSTEEMATNKEECQVVFQLYTLSDSCEENNVEGSKQREANGATTVDTQSALEKSPKDQAAFELQPHRAKITRSVERVRADDSSLISKSGQQVKNSTSSGVILENCTTSQESNEGRIRRQGNSPPEVEGLTSASTSTDVKIEANSSIPASHDVHTSNRGLMQAVQVFLVKAEDLESHALQGNKHTQTLHPTTCLDGIPSGSSTGSQSAGKQCIFYPVKEEEGEIFVEPPLSKDGVPEERTRKSGSCAASGVEECEEVRVGCTQMELHHTLYSSSEEGDVGSEQQSTQGFLEFLSQSSDTEDIDNLQSEPEAETHVMSCYHGIPINRAAQKCKMSSCDQTDGSKIVDYSQTEHQGGSKKGYRRPTDYFIQYFSWDTWKEIAACTKQVSKLQKPVTTAEVAQFVGIHIAMGTLKFPSAKLYWEDCTRVPLISDAMLASRFSELSCKLRLAIPVADVQHSQKSTNHLCTSAETQRPPSEPGETTRNVSQLSRCQDAGNCPNVPVSKTDPLWKVQAIVNRVREGCRALKRHGNHGVDQYPLPFQRYPTHSLHHTVMISVTGLVMDFNLRINDSNREEVVEQMVSWEKGNNQGMVFLCKPELSTPSMLEHLLEVGVRSAGKVGGAKGQIGDEFMTSDGKLKLFRCHHGFILSAVTKERSRSTSLVSGFERAIKAANLNRDLRNLYRTPCTSPLPSAWPLSVLWDLIDLALVNSWLQYKDDHNHVPEPLSFMAFRLEVSKALILPSNTAVQESSVPCPLASKQTSPNRTAAPSDDFESPLPDATTRFDGLGHWPEQLAEGEEARCRFGGCDRTSRVRCLKCCVFLCISRNHNCFLKFHSQGAT